MKFIRWIRKNKNYIFLIVYLTLIKIKKIVDTVVTEILEDLC